MNARTDRMDAGRAYFENHWPRFFEEWKELLRIRSISADPGARAECRRCAQWLAGHLGALGFKTALLETSSHPVVMADLPGAAGKPAVLCYGHYDVQPADPESAWETPPFEPTLQRGRLRARGAQDNKGQLFAVIKALESLIRRGIPLPPVKILLEGDEESGRGVLEERLREWRKRLAARVLLVCDTETAEDGRPAMVMGLRGIVTLTVTVSGPRHDLHSGLHGGVAPNPAVGLARLIASLHDEHGNIAVHAFLDDARRPDAGELRLAEAGYAPDPARYRRLTGVRPVAGDPGRSLAERLGFRPCIDVNGMISGYTGAGSKTIIPARAVAKLSARLAAGQSPAAALRRLRAHLRKHAPAGLKVAVSEAHIGGAAIRLDPRSPIAAAAREVLRDLFGVEPACVWEGASIPVLARLAQVSGAEPVLVGFGSPDDNIHAPNESFRVRSFRDTFRFAAGFLQRLGS